jgi:hypothetical protein
MNRRQAIQILIEHAASDCRGAGVGIRTIPSDAERQRVAEAVRKVWLMAYSTGCDDSALCNLGLTKGTP